MELNFHLHPIYLMVLVLGNRILCRDVTKPENGSVIVETWNSTFPPFVESPVTNYTLNRFLQCAGLPTNMSHSNPEHIWNLKGIIEAALDVYSFMRSSFSQEPIVEMLGGISVNPDASIFHNVDLVKIWFQLKIRPLLPTLTPQFLSCLSTKNFTCEMYQIVVQELNYHFSVMEPVKQKWIYLSFMYPFLAGNNSKGCISQEDSSEDWLMKNFGAFSAMAQFKDFTTLNNIFSGLEVLHLLTAEQKAELLLHPEIGNLDNSNLKIIAKSLLDPFLGNQFQNGSMSMHSMTTAASMYHMTTLEPMTSQQNSLQQTFHGFLKFLKPLRSFVKEFVSLTQGNLTAMKSTTLTQAILNWTLSELAGHFAENVPAGNDILPTSTVLTDNFDITNINDWFQHVVAPVLKHFLPVNQTEIPNNLTAVFYHLFPLNNDTNPQVSGPPDVCTITLKDSQETICSIPNAIEKLTHVFSCITHVDLSLTEENITALLTGLSAVLNSMIQEYSSLNFSSIESHIADVFGQLQTDRFTEENLQDVSFIRLWFQIKLKPLLPSVSNKFLLCLSTKKFTCETFQALVLDLSDNMSLMDETTQQSIYTYFIYPFLSNNKTSDPSCISNTNNSMDWLIKNFGKFSIFAPVQDFFDMYTNLSAEYKGPRARLEVLDILTPNQIAEIILLPLTGPEGKSVVVNAVFNYLLESPQERNLKEVLNSIVILSMEMGISCDTSQLIFNSLNRALSSVPSDTESSIWTSLTELMLTNPTGCIPACLTIPVNETRVCTGVNSSELQLLLNTGGSTNMLCNFSIEQYACASLMQITPENLANLLKCKLTDNTTTLKETWKLFFTKVSGVLDKALTIFSNMSMSISNPAMSDILDVIGDIRINTFSGAQLMDVNFTNYWFQGNLKPFLSFASGEFLSCLSNKNITCETYHNVLQEFSNEFNMDPKNQILVYKYFIYPFLSKNTTALACLSNTNNSMDWLLANFGNFSAIVPLTDLLALNKNFSPLEALDALSPKQLAELIVLPFSGAPDQSVLINTVFDHLLAPPNYMSIMEFLNDLIALSRKDIITCDSYRTIFGRLDQAWPVVPPELQSVTIMSKYDLMGTAPAACISMISNKQCPMTPVNETEICNMVNSTALNYYLATGNITNKLCNFSIDQYACSSNAGLTAPQLAALLKCKLESNITVSKQVWKLFIIKISGVLDETLTSFLNMNFSSSSLSTSNLLDAIGEIRIDSLSPKGLGNTGMWFQTRLQPFLPSVSQEFLSCLGTKNFSCDTYQAIVKSLNNNFAALSRSQQFWTYTYFIKVFLSRKNTSDPGCVSDTHGSAQWIETNLGKFAALTSFADLENMNSNFSTMDTLALLSVSQLAEVAYTPGQLTSAEDAINLMGHISNAELDIFFNQFSSAMQGKENRIPPSVRSAMLQQAFIRANLSEPSVSDTEVLLWLQWRLRPLLINMSVDYVQPYFTTVQNRSCTTKQQAIAVLRSIQSTLPDDTHKNIYSNIVKLLEGPSQIHCYQNNSFYSFVEESFLGFQFPDLSTFLSLMPDTEEPMLINSMSPSNLSSLLSQPNFVDNSSQLCTIFNYYNRTPDFLEKENISNSMRQQILPCVWPLVLSSQTTIAAETWFNSLSQYLQFLNMDLISPPTLLSASCLSFQKFVLVLGNGYNYSSVNFNKGNVYTTIKDYLSTGTKPKCYNATNPDLNSTAWFVDYIGRFINFITLDDINSFGSTQLQVFAPNLANINLFNQTGFPQNISSFYTELVYLQDPNFNPLLLPMEFRCSAPSSSYTELSNGEAMIVLRNLSICTEIDPQISTALAGDLEINVASITALGQQSSALTTDQILTASPSVIVTSLPVLRTVNSWDQGQLIAIIQVLSSGGIQINNGVELLELGTLIGGVPSTVFTRTDPSQLLQISKNTTFVANIMNAPPIIQYTFINQIITVNSAPQYLLINVPDPMADKISRSLLTNFISNADMVQRINMKKWNPEQAVLFFDTVANTMSDPNNISANVLQGFTCSRVQGFNKNKVINLIKTCRNHAQKKVVLQETQLTCMYNYVKDGNPSAFTQYPSDMLVYYNYELVQANCGSYFVEVGAANFDVISDALTYKKDALLQNAKSCLGITGTKINRTNVQILGNMGCILDGSYIANSDPLILENLKNCKVFTSEQVTGMETLLFTGTTKYGDPSTWNINTLEDLGILPLYLTSNFWSYFQISSKRMFLKSFMPYLRQRNTNKMQLKQLFTACNKASRVKRAIGCTTGNITAVTISDEAFPLGYDAAQFNACLTADVVKANLAALADKVVDDGFLAIVLNKLNQAFPSGIADEQVQQLGSISRVASLTDISKWNITKIDTLAALMTSSDGTWTPDQINLIITKYLSTKGNILGVAELNSIGGVNLCALNISLLNTINSSSLQYANILDASNCSTSQKVILFTIANSAFTNSTNISLTSYQLIQPYIGGAPLSYIQLLSTSNVSMDVPTFASLDPNVIMALTVSDVKGLLGNNLVDLKTYENVTVIQNWIASQYRSALSTLGLNLVGGKADLTTTASTAATTGLTVTTATATTSGAGQTTNGQQATTGNPILPLTLLVLIIALQGTTMI